MGPLLKGPIYSSVPTYLLTYVSTATSLHIYRYLATYLPILTYIYRYLPAYLPLLTCTTISTSTYDEELGHKLFRPVRWLLLLPFSHISTITYLHIWASTHLACASNIFWDCETLFWDSGKLFVGYIVGQWDTYSGTVRHFFGTVRLVQ